MSNPNSFTRAVIFLDCSHATRHLQVLGSKYCYEIYVVKNSGSRYFQYLIQFRTYRLFIQSTDNTEEEVSIQSLHDSPKQIPIVSCTCLTPGRSRDPRASLKLPLLNPTRSTSHKLASHESISRRHCHSHAPWTREYMIRVYETTIDNAFPPS
jgi:hypothetical protein